MSFSIPSGLYHLAQGCEERATLGERKRGLSGRISMFLQERGTSCGPAQLLPSNRRKPPTVLGSTPSRTRTAKTLLAQGFKEDEGHAIRQVQRARFRMEHGNAQPTVAIF